MNFWVAIGEETSGPFPVEQIEGMLQQGEITADTLVMAEGEEEWKTLSTVFDLDGATPPPPAPRAPTPPARPIPTMQGPTPNQAGATQRGGVGQHTVHVAQPSSTTPVLVIFAVILVLGGAAALFINQRNGRLKAEAAAAQATYDAAMAKVEAAEAAKAEKLTADYEFSAEGELQPALAIVNGASTRFHKLVVKLSVLGGAAADAFSIGPVSAEPIAIGQASVPMQGGVDADHYEVIDRSGSTEGAAHPAGGIAFEIDFGEVPETTTRTGPLKGSVSVLTGGMEKLVELTGLVSRSTGAINDPALEAAEMTALFKRNEEGGDIEVAIELGPESAKSYSGLELIDGQGNPVESTTTVLRVDNGVVFSKTAPASKFEGAVLRFRFRDGASPVEIPFEVKAVDVKKP